MHVFTQVPLPLVILYPLRRSVIVVLSVNVNDPSFLDFNVVGDGLNLRLILPYVQSFISRREKSIKLKENL